MMLRRSFFGVLAVIAVSPSVLIKTKDELWLKKPQDCTWDNNKKRWIPTVELICVGVEQIFGYCRDRRSPITSYTYHLRGPDTFKNSRQISDRFFKQFPNTYTGSMYKWINRKDDTRVVEFTLNLKINNFRDLSPIDDGWNPSNPLG